MNDKIKSYVGKTGQVNLGGLLVNVKIIDVKQSYGRDRYKVTPVSGKGEIWIERITLSAK